MDNLLVNLLSSLGLSGAAGLNAYVPLLALGLLDRLGYLNLASSYEWLASPWALLAIGVVGLLDFVGDKVPGVDHALHTLGGWVNPVAGAVAFGAQHNLLGDVSPVLAGLVGLLVAGGLHGARTVARPVATATTAGLANPVVSLTEDVTSVGLSVLAVFAPLLAFVALLVVTGLLLLAVSRWRRRRRAL
ncbi:DUF4126 domain-containing protein [Deinococcus pimensis]|uniref:DUF4126 domain-containing protein n=1 Tax=Deinococcus pimensis TaxID=309888 RepID=UPI000489CFB1|nr:DUF4126 domain-containing protein [Deinococcus pimensis]